MPDAAFFSPFGFFVTPDFLEAELCAELRAEMGAAATEPATVHDEQERYAVDERRRSTAWAGVSAATESVLQQRLLNLMPRVGSHFEVELTDVQTLQFLVYRPGDYFLPHRDRNEGADAAAFSRRRQVSVLLFLNEQSDEPAPERYGGGELTFYGLLGDDERARSVGLPLTGRAGLLVAFRSAIVHEVTAVTHGERYTVVTWFQ
jgi:SM-20-related protein